jgi:hypothetical protein
MNTIEELNRILRPPIVAFEQPTEPVLAKCEAELVRLPTDYKAFLKTYAPAVLTGSSGYLTQLRRMQIST